jgi:hypothetical protein
MVSTFFSLLRTEEYIVFGTEKSNFFLQAAFFSEVFASFTNQSPGFSSTALKNSIILSFPPFKAYSLGLKLLSFLVNIERKSYLSDLAYGAVEDPWIESYGQVCLDAKIVSQSRRICRILLDLKADDRHFDRYKNDPSLSPVLNRLMKQDYSQNYPLNMEVVTRGLFRLALKGNSDAASILLDLNVELMSRCSFETVEPIEESP